MKRVMVIGSPGSGKSIFSRKLCSVTKIPLYHLDNLYWNRDRTTVPKEEFLSRLSAAMSADSWIIDGNYVSTMKLRLSVCDTVFFFDLPTSVCLDGIRSRIGTARPDLPWVEHELDSEFEEYVRRFHTETRPAVVSNLAEFSHLKIEIFHSRGDADQYIEKIKNEQI